MLAGEYKAKVFSADGENYASFTVQSGSWSSLKIWQKCKFIFIPDAPEFYEKPKIVQRDEGNIICIKVRAKSHLEMKAEWFKVWSFIIFMSYRFLS